jgi:hypothetical protein
VAIAFTNEPNLSEILGFKIFLLNSYLKIIANYHRAREKSQTKRTGNEKNSSKFLTRYPTWMGKMRRMNMRAPGVTAVPKVT